MYRLTADQETIVHRAREIADRDIAPYAVQVDSEGRFPKESIAALAQAGFLGLTISAEMGGMGQSLRVASAVLDELAQRCPSTGMVYLMHLCGIACYSARPETTAEFLRAAARGEHLSTLAWSERGSRSVFWAPVSQAIRQDGATLISAEKSFATSAGHADGYVVSTRWWDAQQPTDSVLYVVLREDAGLRVDRPWNGLGLRGNASAPMTLDNVRVDDSRLVCEPGKGFDLMLDILPAFQLGNAAVQIGIAEAAVQTTQSYLTQNRNDFLNAKLSDMPHLRTRLAQMRIETDRARAHLVSALDAVENPGPTTLLLVLESKAAAAETAMQVTDLGMRAGGGAAFGKRLSLERHFRDARAAGVMAPTTDQLHEFIGRALCGMDLFA